MAPSCQCTPPGGAIQDGEVIGRSGRPSPAAYACRRMDRTHAQGRAFARAALVGNPSDGFRGAVLAVSLADFSATATAEVSSALELEGPPDLMRAAVHRLPGPRTGSGMSARVRCTTTIPREVGLGGSSAIVIATMRALCGLRGYEPRADELAEAALAAETQDLGIAAGPQDRYAQAHQGLVLMDFASGGANVVDLDPSTLPPLFLAHRREGTTASGVAHAKLRDRVAGPRGEVERAMGELAGLAREARQTYARATREASPSSWGGRSRSVAGSCPWTPPTFA